jgi:hypothetical protein
MRIERGAWYVIQRLSEELLRVSKLSAKQSLQIGADENRDVKQNYADPHGNAVALGCYDVFTAAA